MNKTERIGLVSVIIATTSSEHFRTSPRIERSVLELCTYCIAIFSACDALFLHFRFDIVTRYLLLSLRDIIFHQQLELNCYENVVKRNGFCTYQV